MWLRVSSRYICCLLIMCLMLNQIVNAQRYNGYGNQQPLSQEYQVQQYVPSYIKYSQKQQIQINEDDYKYEGANHRHFEQQNSQFELEDENDTDDFDIENTISDENDMRHKKRYRQQQQQQQQQTVQLPPRSNIIERNSHKCRIWVPIEAAERYKGAHELEARDEIRQLKMIEICCKGFEPIRWRGNTICHPYCESCRNGFCVAPNHCECYPGFVKNDNGDCVFTCPLGCLNGRCYLDGTCQCEPGYKLDETRKYCRPICSGGCNITVGQNCTEPEVCGCAKGFQLKTGGCERLCDPDCGIGGHCNGTCICRTGYKIKEDVCQSNCYQKCDNGICFSPNRCICNPNYQYHEHSTMCIPLQ